MLKQGLAAELKSASAFFERSSSCLTEADSAYAPKEGLYTVANHVAHVAQSIDWFIDGAFNPKGFDMNFEAHIQKALACISLSEARDWFSRAVKHAIEVVESRSEQEWQQPLPQGPIMGGAPRLAVISAISEHTAHHRGALTVYSRLLGKTPPMPYGEM